MALPVCALCGENEATQMITNLENGESLAICADDFPTFILGLAEKMMESGQIELPEDQTPATMFTRDELGLGGPDPDAGVEQLQDAPVGSESDSGPTGPANVRKTPAPKRGAAGRSPAPSTAAPTETVAQNDGEPADTPVSAPAN